MAAPEARPSLPAGLPLTLTVAEAADWLRISKSSVYGLVHRWRVTGGAEGLPLITLALERTWRIPTIAVLRLVGVLDAPVEVAVDGARPMPRLLRAVDHGAA